MVRGDIVDFHGIEVLTNLLQNAATCHDALSALADCAQNRMVMTS